MTVYPLAPLTVHDHERYPRYVQRLAAAVEGFDGGLLEDAWKGRG